MIDLNIRNRTIEQFKSLQSINDLSQFLSTPQQEIFNLTNKLSDNRKYFRFSIPKKSGSVREINAPIPLLKEIQRKILGKLNCLYEPLNTVHGFVSKYENENGEIIVKNIVTNAQAHVRKRFVLNIDLENFFPTFDQKRVFGLFVNQYSINPKISWYLTKLTCTENGLPQGAPTSPVIANMFCSRLDRRLKKLSIANNMTYTRYADDLTFSTRKAKFPENFEKEVYEIIVDEGLKVNTKKTRLLVRENRLEVTGLLVNKKTNVHRKYIRNLRAIFHKIEKYGIKHVETEFYNKYKGKSQFRNYLRGRIEFVGQVRGKEDSIYQKYLQMYYDFFHAEFNKNKIKEHHKGIDVLAVIDQQNYSPSSDDFISTVLFEEAITESTIQIKYTTDEDFSTKRNSLIKEYNSKIVDALLKSKHQNKSSTNIISRIEDKLEKARDILLAEAKDDYLETVYLLMFTCLNEFFRLTFNVQYNGQTRILKLNGRVINEDNYSYAGKLLFLNHNQKSSGFLLEVKSIKEPPRPETLSYCIPIYIYEELEGKYIKQFVILNEIRNRLNLTHSDKESILKSKYYPRVSWEQCAWLYSFLYFIFINKEIKYNKIFQPLDQLQKYFIINKGFSQEEMEVKGKIYKIEEDHKISKLRYIYLEFPSETTNRVHRMKARYWNLDKNDKETEVQRSMNINKIGVNDFVSLILDFNVVSNDNREFFNIDIVKIKKIEPPKNPFIF